MRIFDYKGHDVHQMSDDQLAEWLVVLQRQPGDEPVLVAIRLVVTEQERRGA